jgi:tetratricopeptide (TPR) repeat protein
MKSMLFLLTMVIMFAVPALAQETSEDELVCDAFADSGQETRVSYYMGEGAGFLGSGQYARALESYTCVIEQVDENFVGAYIGRAVAHTARQEYELAIEDYTSAIALDGSLTAAYNNRGIVNAAIGEYELALADFDAALAQDSNYILAYNNRAVIRAVQGDYAAALADLDQGIGLSGIDAVVTDLSNPDRAPGAPTPEFNPDHAQAYALRGIIYSAQALDNYADYLLLRGSQGDQRIQSAAGALESRFTFELRLDDGTWLLSADFAPSGEELAE